MKKLILVCTTILVVAGLVACSRLKSDPAIVVFRIMGTTDLHSALMDYDYAKDRENSSIGLVRVATLIGAAREENQNNLLVDNGDLIQGTVLGDFAARNREIPSSETHPMIQAMNALEYDVANIGNHDLNYGLDYLKSCMANAGFPFISANLCQMDGKEPIFQPYAIVTKNVVDDRGASHPLRVGLIGLLPPQVMRWDRNHLEGNAVARDMVETAREWISELRPQVDLIVVLAHSGLRVGAAESTDENAVWFLSELDGIDAILFGHSHDFFPGPTFDGLKDRGVDNELGQLNGVPAAMAGMYGNHLGIIDLTLKWEAGNWTVQDSRSFLKPISIRGERGWEPVVDRDEGLSELVQTQHQAAQEWIRQPLGETQRCLSTYFALVCDSSALQLIADAQLWHARRLVRDTPFQELPILSACAPFKAGASRPDQYTHIAPGPLAFRHVADLYLYPNTISVVKINGQELGDWLEMSAGVYSQIDPDDTNPQHLINREFPTFNFDVIKGVDYQIDVTQPPRYDVEGKEIHPNSSRIRHLTFEGKPVAKDQWFLVVTNNYRASGGGNFPHLTRERVVLEDPVENRKIIAEFIREKKMLAGTCAKNWRLAPLPPKVLLEFLSSPNPQAVTYAKLLGNMDFTGEIDAEGYGIFRVNTGQ